VSISQKNKNPSFILKKYFGYDYFRPGQLEIIQNIIQKKDTLSILPTGGGKSICFQVPGLIFPGITLVISPLISLMKDQVDTLKSKGISACYISSLQTAPQLNSTYQLLKLNKFKFVYIAPERLKSQKFQNIISKLNISLLVIDEAHCISQWGDTFRPSYKQIITNSKNIINNCPIAAFTATANQKVQTDICQTLKLKNPFIFYNSFKRTNLTIEIINCFNQTIKNLVLLRLLKKHAEDIGIVYCSTRGSTEQLAQYLKLFKINSLFYHGGLDKKQKQDVQLEFITGHTKLIIATNAFGMGIDVSNIRFIIHYQIPGNIENYYQEIGRAGRDGKQSRCYTLFCKSDIKIQLGLLKKYSNKILDFQKLQKIIKNRKCRTQEILKYFGERSDPCGNCDICLKIKYKSQLMIHIDKKEILAIQKLINLKMQNKLLCKQFPLTDSIIAFLVLFKPQNKNDYYKIPGIGLGFMEKWFDILNYKSIN
jgi:ATP-dependent DNA helicase RecQ